jgi:hypothetical protein
MDRLLPAVAPLAKHARARLLYIARPQGEKDERFADEGGKSE